jgi:lipid-A-disaccharide synthase
VKYYLIAGEASGDLHGSNLMKSLKVIDPKAEFRYMGGDLMHAQGGALVKHFREMAHMGLDVILHISTVLKNMGFCKNDIEAWNPDVLILIDYWGFNSRIGLFAKSKGIKTFFYIAPKVWAWKESRVKILKQFVDKLFVIFPFEVEYFKKHGIEAEYFGNPLNDSIHAFLNYKEGFETFAKKNGLSQKPIIAMVAGSRKSEISRLLPEMLEAMKNKNEYQLIVAGAPSINKNVYDEILKSSDIKVVYGQTYNLISNAVVAIVTSGTATLETALLKIPQVVVFKAGLLSFVVGRSLVKLKFFSLVNLILNRQAVLEILQFNIANKIDVEVDKILSNPGYRNRMLADYITIEKMLGEHGVSDRLAKRMVELLTKN